mmetsp:Transcript_55787/g.137000  ORF Transcript_55787/g.137000 Transcript_55787/m.137000 type:complete len:82 (+) Transcript_55787:565-810(+)
MTRISSASTTVDNLCAMTMLVRCFCTDRKLSVISSSVLESSALVASSQTSTDGDLRMHRAIATRWRSPPDNRTPLSPTTVS